MAANGAMTTLTVTAAEVSFLPNADTTALASSTTSSNRASSTPVVDRVGSAGA